jgi:hypothetical protein
LRRKRTEYQSYLKRSYDRIDWAGLIDAASMSGSGGGSYASASIAAAAAVGPEEIAIMKQIRKDVPRTSGGVVYLHHPRVMQTLERVLYVWAVRHPACGYVQGMNDLVLPFLHVSLTSLMSRCGNGQDLTSLTERDVDRLFDTTTCALETWMEMEADLYWMSSKMLNGIQENFTYNQAGVHQMVRKLERIVQQVDPTLWQHLENNLQIPFNQFAFRWMNCLLTREFGMRQVLRLWDTYLSEESVDVNTLHVFVCSALLLRFRQYLVRGYDFSDAMTFLQNLPTDTLQDRDMDELISEGFLKLQLYGNCIQLRS